MVVVVAVVVFGMLYKDYFVEQLAAVAVVVVIIVVAAIAVAACSSCSHQLAHHYLGRQIVVVMKWTKIKQLPIFFF